MQKQYPGIETYRAELKKDGSVLRSNLDKAKPLTPTWRTRTMANWYRINSTLSGRLCPCIQIMNVSRNWNEYEAFVFIFLLRWNFYPAANEFWYSLNFVIWCKTCKIQNKKLMQIFSTVLTQVPRWTFMDSLKREARPDAGEESMPTGCLNARNTANVIWKL